MGVKMTTNIKDIKINYIQYGKGPEMVLLHGWGQNIEMMDFLGKPLADSFHITILDFPGFGKSEEPKDAWRVDDYAELLHELLKNLKVENPILVGHSFGGRVSILYASKYKVDKVVLFGSPCIRKPQKENLQLKMLKKLKTIPGLKNLEGFAKKHMGSADYRNASDIMRKTLVLVINQDLTEAAKKIEVPTLLIWGQKDTEAPLEDAKELEKIMQDAALITYPDGTHYTYLEHLNEIIPILKTFGKEKSL